jgi:hypothetical protein
VRVTAPRSGARVPVSSGSGTGDPSAVYVRSLIRSQLRIALLAAAVFAVLLGAAMIVPALVPEVRELAVAGIPLVWIVLGAGIYPIVLLVAWLFTRAADRNERRYRSLAEDS